MAGCAQGVCTVTASPCYCGTPSCRLATERRFLSTVGGSTWSTACPAVRSTLISGPTPCFLMGAHGPRGLSGMTWTMPWRRLLMWRSLTYDRSVYLTQWARLSHYTPSRTTRVEGTHWWGVQRLPGSLPRWLGVHGEICSSPVLAAARHLAHHCWTASSFWYLCKGGQIPWAGDQTYGSRARFPAPVVEGSWESHLQQGPGAFDRLPSLDWARLGATSAPQPLAWGRGGHRH
jgi:hypothetical protein